MYIVNLVKLLDTKLISLGIPKEITFHSGEHLDKLEPVTIVLIGAKCHLSTTPFQNDSAFIHRNLLHIICNRYQSPTLRNHIEEYWFGEHVMMPFATMTWNYFAFQTFAKVRNARMLVALQTHQGRSKNKQVKVHRHQLFKAKATDFESFDSWIIASAEQFTEEDIKQIRLLDNARVPPDNAMLFVKWLRNQPQLAMANVEIANSSSQKREEEDWERSSFEDGSEVHFNLKENRVVYCYKGC